MIPHIIHLCWFGKGKYPQLTQMCIDSWKRNLPDYQIMVWNEDNFDVNSTEFTKVAYQQKKWAFISDYVRLKALQEYGTEEGVIVITTGEPKKNDDGKNAVPFQQVAQKPGFNGGDANEFSKYVAQNVVYPESCRQSKIEGRVTLEFTVTETGKVADIKILRSVNDDLDREAVRVIAQSPLWTPGRDENGKVVPVKYTFPVIFKLPDSENK